MEKGVGNIRIKENTLHDFCTKIFQGVGMPLPDAQLVARDLVLSDLRGVFSHGVMRVPIYEKRLALGLVKCKPNISIVKETDATALVDGDDGMGMVVSTKAMELCIEKAKKSGASFVGAKNSNHFGMAGLYPLIALEHDMIGISFTGPSCIIVVPTGGAEPVIDNNPISIAIPAGKEYPILLDMATSVVARGWIFLAAKKGEKIPLDWAVDRNGNPTDDPNEALKGALQAVAGYKGYGLALVIGILGGLFTGSRISSKEVVDYFTDFSSPQKVGHLFAAIRADSFMPLADFKAKMDDYIREIKNSRRASENEEIYLPGEKEFRNTEKHRSEGIPIAQEVVEELNSLGKKYGLGSLPVWASKPVSS